MTPIELLTIPSTRGSLAAAVHRPDHETSRLAVLCPGFCDSKDYAGLVGLANTLCSVGYTVVRFDPTGTWESDGSINDYSTTQYLVDIRHVIDFMLRDHAYTTILLGGNSRGAGTAISYAATDPRISLLVAIMSSTGRWLTEDKRTAWETTGVRVDRRDLPDDPTQVREFRVPYSFQQDRDRYDAIAALQQLRVPILFLAGAIDTLVLPDDVRTLFERANEPKQFVVIPGISHDYRRDSQEIARVNHAVQTWLSSVEDSHGRH